MTDTYDYVIVGAGSAGCVVANRLSADLSVSVCLIEAGPRDANPWIHVPVGIANVIADNALDWSFWTTPQAGCDGRRLFMPRGKTLGGSSAINAMVAVRGHPRDYDDWAAAGATGWSYEEILPYFKKAEAFEGFDETPDAARWHGRDGPLAVSRPRYVNPLVDAFIEAAVATGIPRNDDFGGATSEGVGLFHVFERGGRRFSNADAYLHPIEGRQNLDVIIGATVERILFEGTRASGVVRNHAGATHDVLARREVILCAGAIGSPQLLLLSGVGPAADLQNLGIPVVADVPEVGKNLQDHLDIHLSTIASDHLALSVQPSAFPRLALSLGRYLVFHSGELSTNISQAGAFVRTTPDARKPDVQWHFSPVMNSADGLDPTLVRDHYGYTLVNCALSPRSRGSVRLASADPFDEPLIDPNYLDHPDDLTTTLRGLHLARTVLDRPEMARHREREYEPGADVATDEALAAYVRARGATTYHPVGTLRMGSDDAAPVTPDLRLRGVQGLRVIDASVMPLVTGGNTNGPTTMIAEKGADLVRTATSEPSAIRSGASLDI